MTSSAFLVNSNFNLRANYTSVRQNSNAGGFLAIEHNTYSKTGCFYDVLKSLFWLKIFSLDVQKCPIVNPLWNIFLRFTKWRFNTTLSRCYYCMWNVCCWYDTPSSQSVRYHCVCGSFSFFLSHICMKIHTYVGNTKSSLIADTAAFDQKE